MSVTSGAYSATWNALAIGQFELGGIRERYNWQGKEIRFDSVGMSPVTMLFGGIVMAVDFVAMEYDAAAIATMRWPWHANTGQVPPAGTDMWARAKPLILTSCRADINPQTKTFFKTILAPGYDVELDYSAVKERSVPIRLLVFPVKHDAGGYATPAMPTGCLDNVYYTETYFTP